MKIVLLVLCLTLTACATTPPGKSMERGHYADMLSTAIALSVNPDARELNPLGYALIPLKMMFGSYFEDRPCEEAAYLAKISNTITYGASANNLAVAVSISSAPVVGVLTGFLYWFWLVNYETGLQCSTEGLVDEEKGEEA